MNDEISMLQECLKELNRIQKSFIDYKQTSDEQLTMFYNELTDMKVSWILKLKELEGVRDAWADEESKKQEVR